MTDVVVVGGGVIGGAIALALAKRGAEVCVVERGPAAGEAPGETGVASWAAAGVLGAQIEGRHDGPLVRLCLASRARYPAWIAGICEATGLDVEMRAAGVMRPAYGESELAAVIEEVAWQEQAGLRVERLDAAAAIEIEPEITREIVGAVRFPDDRRIDPPSLVRALRAAMARAGVELRAGATVRGVLVRDGRARGVEIEDRGSIEGDAVVVAAGSWSSRVALAGLAEGAIEPARGQMIELGLAKQIVRGVIDGPECYLSPRDDGRVLVGSTVERVGFRTGATASVVRDLLGAAIRLVPGLAEATVRRAWAGFRPVAADELPMIGASEIAGLYLATGHFRNGVLLAPITAEIIAALISGEAPPSDVALAPFDPKRFAA